MTVADDREALASAVMSSQPAAADDVTCGEIVVIGGEDSLTKAVCDGLANGNGSPVILRPSGLEPASERQPEEEVGRTVIYLAGARGRRGQPDVEDAARVFERTQKASRLVVVASAAIYEPDPHHPGIAEEDRLQRRRNRNAIAARWRCLEELAEESTAGSERELVVLRPCAVAGVDGADGFFRLLTGRVSVALAGHDPSVQLLSQRDFCRAISAAVGSKATGVFNLAPRGVIPLRKAMKLAGVRRLPWPRWLRWLTRKAIRLTAAGRDPAELEYERYSWTVSGARAARQLGFVPLDSSANAVRSLRASGTTRELTAAAQVLSVVPPPEATEAEAETFDDYGLDRGYIAAFRRTLFRFLHDAYWRIEVQGLESVPKEGRAVLVGVHRGFQPWDGVMAVHLLSQELGRYPRFLIHPSLLRWPFLANYMSKLGGIVACQENADCVLGRDEILGVYPEGIRGAFKMYRDAYRLGRFGNHEYVRIALRNRAPIVPFANIGSAEIYPILGRIDWKWWKRYSEWPFFPITPTMGTVPLPSKWHTRFLAPLHIERVYGPEAADDMAVVRSISREVRGQIEDAMMRMLRLRRSIFFGKVFQRERTVW